MAQKPTSTPWSLIRVVRGNADHVQRELAVDDLVMAQGHAILLAQQSAELLQSITDHIEAQEGAPS